MKASGRKVRIRYLKTVTALETITNRPPSRIHLAAPGCFSAKLFGETNAPDIYEEMMRGMDALLEKYGWVRDGMAYRGGEDKTIALFCHHGLGSALLGYLIGISPVVAQHNLFLAPTSVTTLVSETDSNGVSHFRATAIGDTSHLYAGGEPVSESGLYPRFNK